MSERQKKRADAGELASPAKRQTDHRVGDTVLYAHRSKDAFKLVPMIITNTYPGDTIVDGVVISADQFLMPNGIPAKSIRLIQKGTSEGTWQPLR